jgi:RNA polymerase sigma factor (TIGR02999 family)
MQHPPRPTEPSGHPPPEATTEQLEVLFGALATGDREALDTLFHAVYGELRRLAHAQRARWHGETTLNTTALVHETYLKLARYGAVRINDRGHFYALASLAMRQILVNYAERRQAAKRGGNTAAVPLDEAYPVSAEQAHEILGVHRALGRLAAVSERAVRVVECRFFAGLNVPETAEALGVSAATVKRDWTLATTWLRRELDTIVDGGGGGGAR